MAKAVRPRGFQRVGSKDGSGDDGSARPLKIALVSTLALTGVWLFLAGGLTLDNAHRGSLAVVRVLMHAPGPLAWMLSAFGLGLAIAKALRLSSLPHSFSLALGCCAMLIVDAVAGVAGVFGIAGGTAPAALLLLPGYFGLWKNYKLPWPRKTPRAADDRSSAAWFAWTLAAPLAVLVLACASAPGWLWSTEFGGYDALSYHLELPREWLARGRITSLDHNAYSLLPSYMEAAYLHLMALRGGAHSAALSAQVLHALFALAAAVMTGVVARTSLARSAAGAATPASASTVRWVASAVFLGTPWVIVTGSLAYNEMPMVLALAAGLYLVLSSDRPASRAEWLALGLLIAGAMGAKLTAVLFVAAPLTIALGLRGGLSLAGWARSVATVAIVGFLLLAPWWGRVWLETGSAFFPIIGSGGLSADRAAAFHAAHGAPPISELWGCLRDQFLAAGLGDPPSAHEPWRPFWSILPWVGIVTGGCLIAVRSTRRCALILIFVVAINIVLWLLFTHAKGRFLLPSVVPLAVLVALFASPLERAGWLGKAALAGLAGVWCLQPLLMYASDGPAIDGNPSPATGIGMEPILSGEVEGTGLPAMLRRLPEGSRVATLGAATVFWWPMIPGYSTVWNDGPVTRAMRAANGDMANAVATLRQEGWTHLVIDPTMLTVWERSGWLDPLLTPEAVNALARQLRSEGHFGSMELFSLR